MSIRDKVTLRKLRHADNVYEFNRSVLHMESVIGFVALFSVRQRLTMKSTELIVKLQVTNMQPKEANISWITLSAVSLFIF